MLTLTRFGRFPRRTLFVAIENSNLICGSGVRSKPQRLHHRIVERHSHLRDLHIFPRRIHAVRQQHNKKLPVGIDIDRSPRKSRVSVGMWPIEMPAEAAFARHNPTKRPRAIR